MSSNDSQKPTFKTKSEIQSEQNKWKMWSYGTELHNREHRWRHAQHPSIVFIKHFVLTSYRWFYQWMLEMALFSLPIFQNCWCIANQDNFTFVSLTLFLLLPLPSVLQCRQAALGRQKWVISPQIAFVTSQFIMTMFNEWGTLQAFLNMEHGSMPASLLQRYISCLSAGTTS